VAAVLAAGCRCGLDCLPGLDTAFVLGHRSNVARLSRAQHDMYLMGLIMATMGDPKATSKRKERQRIRNKYMFQGREVCLEAFLYLENVTAYHVKAIRAHVLEAGVAPRGRRAEAVRPAGGALAEHCARARALLAPRLQGQRPGWRRLHQLYTERFREATTPGLLMGYSAFRAWAGREWPERERSAISLPVGGPRSDTLVRLQLPGGPGSP
jgi:hypothetical protein